eukprot:GFYU01024826.1.p1 GENE.GFYU01024826.1~~GFYU01024826.1.p1  ORF type:complete len:267 (-),score=50.57 GFYU01024826.1:83-883(-)
MGWRPPVMQQVDEIRATGSPKLKRFWIMFFSWGLSFYTMSIFVTISSAIYPKKIGRLPDQLFNILPEVYLANSLDIVLGTLALLCIIRCVFHPQGITALTRFFALHAFVMMFRSVCLIVTSQPDPSPSCVNFKEPENWLIFYPLGQTTCGDMMFSGHTAFYCLLGLNVWRYFGLVECVLATLITSTATILLVIGRIHYTIDIIIGLYVAWTVNHLYHLYALEPTLRGRVGIVTWLEAHDHESEYGVDEKNPETMEQREGLLNGETL